MVFRVFLTGKPGTGKTGLLIRALSDLRFTAGGYVFLPLKKEDGSLCTGLVSPQVAAAPVLPFAAFEGSVYEPERLGEIVCAALDEAVERDMGYFDGLLGAELADTAAAEKLAAFLTQEIPAMGVLCDRETTGDAVLYDKLLQLLTEDEQTLLINVDELEEKAVIAQLRSWAEAITDWANHKKFDPLMKLRARRRKGMR